MDHLSNLEAESVYIIREVAASFARPVMMYSIGKDSSVLLHLALKAFYPAIPPFPILHIDTSWKFREMIAFRNQRIAETGMKLIVHRNEDAIAKGINVFTHGSSVHTDELKTVALRQALDVHKFDCAIGGARRDEERSRAKERIMSFRNQHHRWDPKRQRPELWQLYNTRIAPGESVRAFPISNWTELDIWQYIRRENIPVVPLYFAKMRPTVIRDGQILMVDDERIPLHDGETPQLRMVRFRTLGCYPLTAAVESEATTIEEVVYETLSAKTSERAGRLIDFDKPSSMEQKKIEGYF
ncbi:MAG: sulfate adenylyltransferase subunit CysD [Chloroflexia bacterium]|nr:sulfate adenylyltransferase subunit CysD [Chloroflexia bacterium]